MRHFITAQNTACGAHAPHKILAAALHAARDAACGGSSAPPQHGVLPAAFGQYPNSTASSTQSIRIGFAMILQRPYGAESSRRPRFAGHQPCMHLHPANRQCHPPAQRVAFCAARHARHRLKPLIKKPAGTQMDPGRSADAEYVAGRAAWRPRQQHPRGAITSVAPARPCPRPRGLKALTARRCRRS